MNINEEQNPAKMITTSCAHSEFHHSSKLHNLSSVNNVVSSIQHRASHRLRNFTYISNNSTLSPSELIQMFCKSYETHECCISSLRTFALDCTFQCCSIKKGMATDLGHN